MQGENMNINQLPMIMGSLLIVVGIGLVIYQLGKAISSGKWTEPNSANFSLARWQFQAAYPGITMVCIGALLLGVGALVRSN